MKRLVIVLALLLISATGLRAQVSVIAHPSVSVNEIDVKTLTEIYLLNQTTWKDGSALHVFAPKRGATWARAFHAAVGRDAVQLRKIWLRTQLTGEGRAPTLVEDHEMVAMVAGTPGAIGFVQTATASDRVKVLLLLGQ